MKKLVVSVLTAVLLVVFASCKDLKRNNPYDPAGSAYGGVTYKGDVWYPDNTLISSMIVVSGGLVFGGSNPVDGDCVIKMTGDSTYTLAGYPGEFSGIKDLCADNSGNIYVVDSSATVKTVSVSDVTGSWPIVHTSGIDNLSIECLNNSIFISNNADMTITNNRLVPSISFLQLRYILNN